MKHIIIVASIAAVATAQGFGGPGRGGPPNTYPGLPACLSSCFTSNAACNFGDIRCYCNSTSIDTINACINGTSCSSTDKNAAYQGIAQLCANNGATVTASQEASFKATSGGTLWPTQWTTDSAYAAGWSSWKAQTTGGPFGGAWGAGNPGWNAADGRGPFGGAGNGWGHWESSHSGAWTTGPWTRWWGTSACPPSTWPGWTSGTWSTSPPWTSWTACTATPTATSVVTVTVTANGTPSAVLSSAVALKVQETILATSTTGNAALATSFGAFGVAAGAVGVLAGAILL